MQGAEGAPDPPGQTRGVFGVVRRRKNLKPPSWTSSISILNFQSRRRLPLLAMVWARNGSRLALSNNSRSAIGFLRIGHMW